MDDADTMGRLQRPADLLRDLDRLLRRQLLFLLHEGAQVLPGDELHGDKLHPFAFAQVVNANHVLMRNLMRQAQFLLEALNDCRVASQIWADHFQRDGTIELPVRSFVNRAHAALAKQLDDLVPLPEQYTGLQNRLVG